MRSLDPAISNALLQEVERYYSRKVIRYGPTPLGVDWRCEPSQYLRFIQLLRICEPDTRFSLNDLGCGYGALRTFIAWRYPGWEVDYFGADISSAMVERASRRWRGDSRTTFASGSDCTRAADYSIASGIFNVSLCFSAETWARHVATVLRRLEATSVKGFAVNFMVCADDRDRASGSLYRTSPSVWESFCTADLGCQVEVIGGYGLPEFTLLARKPGSAASSSSRWISVARSGS